MFLSDSERLELTLWCAEYINTHCIIRRPSSNPMPAKNGGTYTWIFYLRRGLFNPEFAHKIAKLSLDKIYASVGSYEFQIAGLESGSTPLLSAITLVARMEYGIDINAFSVRKKRKEYGLLNMIEGIPNSKPVIVLDDLCNSSASLNMAYRVCVEHGHAVIPYSFALVNKVNKAIHLPTRVTTDMYLPAEVTMGYLFDLDTFDLRNPSH